MRHIYKCPYSDIVDCLQRPCPERCEKCGWHPDVDHRRREKLRELAQEGRLRKRK